MKALRKAGSSIPGMQLRGAAFCSIRPGASNAGINIVGYSVSSQFIAPAKTNKAALLMFCTGDYGDSRLPSQIS